MRPPKILLAGLLLLSPLPVLAERKTLSAQIQLPHNYYYREMYLPQLTNGPSALIFSPDGKELGLQHGWFALASNREVAYGTGDIWSVAVNAPEDLKKIFSEETAWRAQPQVAPDGRRVLFSRYHGREWQQLWLATMQGAAPLPLTFGKFDRTEVRI